MLYYEIGLNLSIFLSPSFNGISIVLHGKLIPATILVIITASEIDLSVGTGQRPRPRTSPLAALPSGITKEADKCEIIHVASSAIRPKTRLHCSILGFYREGF